MSLLLLFRGSGGAPGDTTAPTLTVTVNPDKTRISLVSGANTSTFSFTVDEDFQAYQLRVVPGNTSPVTAGTLVESGGGGTAGATITVNVTGSELQAAGLGEATYIVKAFAQDLAGNWST